MPDNESDIARPASVTLLRFIRPEVGDNHLDWCKDTFIGTLNRWKEEQFQRLVGFEYWLDNSEEKKIRILISLTKPVYDESVDWKLDTECGIHTIFFIDEDGELEPHSDYTSLDGQLFKNFDWTKLPF